MVVLELDLSQVFRGLALLGGLWLGYEVFLSPLKGIPGPFAARFTDIWRALLTYLGNVDEHHRRWHREYGAAVRVGPNTISINDPNLIKTIYATKDSWLKSDMYRPNDVIVNGRRIPNIFNTSDKAFHALYTRPIGPLWSLSRILELEPLMDETLSLFTGKIGETFADTGKVCMMDEWLTYFAWDVTANIAFGRHYGFIEQGKDVEGLIAESTAGLKYFAPISQVPWLDDWLDKNPVCRIGPKPLVNGFIYTVKVLTQHQRGIETGTAKHKETDTFLDRYICLKETHPELADDEQIINWLMLHVGAGGDSTAGALRSVVYHLGRHPRAYTKLEAELKDARLALPAQWRHVRGLKYLDAAIWEAFRVTPALGLILERDVPAGGFTLPDGRFIPAGTKVGINPVVVTRDVGVFGPGVETYDPDRWLQKSGESDEEFSLRRRRMQETTDLMFGAGSRVCVGKYMARLEIYKLLATLYSTFDVRFKDPSHTWKYHNAWFMYQRDIPMMITPRAWA